MKKKVALLIVTLSVLASGLTITTFDESKLCPAIKCTTVPPPNPYF